MKIFAKSDKAIHTTRNKEGLNLAVGKRMNLPVTTLQLQMVMYNVKKD
jgi:hypothetical protein